MKRIITLASLLIVMGLVMSTSVLAQQWSNGAGNDIYKTVTSGNVGIGLTNPAYPLHIYTSGTGASDGAVLELDGKYASTDKNIGIVLMKNTSTGDMFFCGLRTWDGGQRQFIMSGYDAATSTWGEFMNFNYTTKKYWLRSGITDVEYDNSGNTYFNNTGGVGVGVTALGGGVKFQVAGKIKCQEVEVAITPWPDHVFRSDYNLKPLGEVESYILQNKHLPDVPNDQEVQAKGVDLGKMNATLLQKVEELTLYVIQLKKDNDQLTERVKKLEH